MNRFGWKQLLIILPMVVIALLLTNRQTEPQPQPATAHAATTASDYYLRGAHISHLGSDGRIKDEIFSELLTHYPHDNHADLIAPRFRIHRPNGENIWAQAEEGVLYGEDKMVLKQAVSIEQRSATQTITDRIESEEIEIERQSKKITSRSQVTITGTNYTIVAGAMELLSDERQLYLSQGVRGHYVP
jgi:LPS export ABC transporter protein LptC